MTRFADPIDHAAHHEQQSRDIAIKKAQEAAQSVPVNESGHCWQCDSLVVNPRRFCDKHCADLWSRENE